MRIRCLPVLLPLVAVPAAAEPLDLATVLARVAAHPELEARAREAEAAAAEARAAAAEGGLVVDGRVETLLRYAREGGTVAPLVTDRQSIVFSRPLYDGGLRAARAAGAEARARAADFEATAARRELLLAAVAAYAAVWRDRALLEEALARERRLALLLAAERRRYRLGAGTAGAVALVETRHAEAMAERARRSADLATSGAVFRRLVGEDPLALAPPAPPDGLPGDPEAALAALGDHPALAAAEARVEAARARLRETRAALWPQLALTGRLERIGGVDPRRGGRGDVAVGAVLRLPLYDSGVTRARLAAARARLAAAEARLAAVRRRLEAEVREAFARWREAEGLRAPLRRREAAARTALETVRREAMAGLRPVTAVLEAEEALATAVRARIVREAERVVAGWRLAAALGHLDSVAAEGAPPPAEDPDGETVAAAVAASADVGLAAPPEEPRPPSPPAAPEPAIGPPATVPRAAAVVEPAAGPDPATGTVVFHGRLTGGD